MHDFEYEFSAQVEGYDFGRMAYAVVYASESIVRQLALPDNPRLRIDAVIADIPFHGAFQPARGRRYYLILSKSFRKAARLSIGDEVLVCFDIADQDAVNVPRQLEFALNANQRAKAVWDSISPGKKRGLAYRVATAKQIATIENRVEEVIDTLLAAEDTAE